MTTSSNDITIRQIGQEELDRFQQRIVQIFLDAFTTDGFAFNAQRATEAKAVRYQLKNSRLQAPALIGCDDKGKWA